MAFKAGSSIALSVESPGVVWRGQTYHLVTLSSIEFGLESRSGHLTAQLKGGVYTFDNVTYEISAAVFDAAGRLLGAARVPCEVPRIMEGKSTVMTRSIALDFGESLDYARAATFMIGISNRKVRTPDDWQREKDNEAVTLMPRPITLSVSTPAEGWRTWQGMGHPYGTPIYAECLTAIAADNAGNLWVGTSRGRLFSMDKDDRWTLQANLQAVEITGIAVDGANKVWLSTNDGLRRLSREGNAAKLTEYHRYYQGEPAGVSGGYIPDADGIRFWGYVDRVYIPPKNRVYAPIAVSTEHGLFCFGEFHEVWHHFMPHYWGGNSDWLDLSELIPHRRPTRVVEDAGGNLWVGTQWDGFVRFNAAGRDYNKRSPPKNAKDGTEFSYFGSADVGVEFDRVVDLTAGRKRGVWGVVARKNDRPVLVRFDGEKWSNLALASKSRRATCIAEVRPGVALVGAGGDYSEPVMFEVDWKSRTEKAVPLPPNIYDIFEIVVLPGGRVFAISWSGLFERR